MQTFDLIQQRQAEVRDLHYSDCYPSGDDPTILHDSSRNQEPLHGWSLIMHELLNPAYYPIKLPNDAEWYEAMYTSPDSRIELKASSAQKMAAFVLRNKPYSMDDPVRVKLVISETGEPDISLLTNHPLLTVWGGPAGPYAGESPLLRDVTDPTAWQPIVAEIFDEVRNIS